jgi:hypothetical protein
VYVLVHKLRKWKKLLFGEKPGKRECWMVPNILISQRNDANSDGINGQEPSNTRGGLEYTKRTPKRLDSSKFGKTSFKRKKELMCFRETYCKSLHRV